MIESRPLSQAERRDIVSHTDHLLARLRERLRDDNSKACVRLVYIGFGFKIMREHFTDEESWKAYVRKHYPLEGYTTINRYIAIGRHFHYDDSYLDFLSGCGYAVPPSEIDQKRNIGSQLDDMRKNGAKVGSPSELLKAIDEYLPEPEVRRKALTTARFDKSPASQQDGERSDVTNGDHEVPRSDKTVVIDENAFVASHLAQRLLKSLAELTTSKSLFEKLADTTPVTEWDKETVLQLKRALRPAKQMIDHLFEAV